ncbi:dolichyl-phosphate beta-D-mannosyltransferase [Desulfocarbo indianensis]|nr:dolichyl-phosphate beta-D-mannosyltransferase [Desulfocarbo indianensis]
MEVLVVVPTYNEAENLPRLAETLLSLELDLGILVVDDGSPDGTGRLADEMAAADPRVLTLHREGKQGLGTAYVQGFQYGLKNTDAKLFVQMDADFSHNPCKVPELAAVARQGQVAIGSRYVKGGGVKNWGLGRRILSRGGSLYARLILGLPISDVTGGFKCWPREVLEDLDLDSIRSNGYAFQAEMSYRAKRKGHSLSEVPIIFVDRRVGQSKMSPGIALEAVWLVWRLRFGK